MKLHNRSRRSLLKQLGVSAGLLPLLDVTKSFGAEVGFPKRLLVVVWTNGTIPAQFWPQGVGTKLSDLTLPAITAPLEPYKKDVLFISGLETRNFSDNPGSAGFGHQNYATTFTATKGKLVPGGAGGEPLCTAISASIDQYIADDVAKRVALPLRSLHLSVLRGGSAFYNCCIYRNGGAAVAPDSDPAAVAGRIFSGQNQQSAQLTRTLAQRRSVLDFVAKDLEGFGRNLGKADGMKVAAHLDGVRELEKQLAGLATAKCTGLGVPKIAMTVQNYPAIVDAQTSIIASAFKCDLTRVATLQLGDYNGDAITFPWIGVDGKGTTFPARDWHDCAHNPGTNSDTKVKVDNWFLQQFAALIKKFKDIPEGGGTMLDNTAILFANHMTNGALHNCDNLPWIVAGGCGGYFKTGRFLRAPARTPSNKLFVGLAQAMGVNVPNGAFGDAEYAGLLPDL